MALDLENPEVKAEVDALREAARAEATAELSEKYAGLERNHEQVVEDRKAASAKAKAAEAQVERYQAATQGKDIDEVESTFSNIEKADYVSLLGQEKFDEAYELRAKAERKDFAKQLEAEKQNTLSIQGQMTAQEEELMVLSLDNVAVEKYLGAKGKESGLRDMKARIRADAKRDAERNITFPDQFGNPRKDSKGEDLTIDTYIDEVLRTEASHLFPDVKGSGAPGSGGNAAPGNGKKRSEMSSEEAGKFMSEHGVDAYQKIPA